MEALLNQRRRSWEFYQAVCRALRTQLEPLGATFKNQPHHVRPEMISKTPTFVVYKDGTPLGYVCWDRSMVEPVRFFTMSTGIGGRDANNRFRDITVKWPAPLPCSVLREADRLGLRESSVRHYFQRAS